MIQHYLVIDLQSDGFLAHQCDVNDREKSIRVISSWKGYSSRDFLHWIQEREKEIHDNALKVIITVGSDMARTTYEHISFVRKELDEIISESELESVMTQLIWKNDNQPVPFGYSLQALYVRSTKIDDHIISNPLGFTGEKITIYFNKTIIRDDIYKEFFEHIPIDKLLCIHEAGSVCSYAISRSLLIHEGRKNSNPYIVIDIRHSITSIYSYAQGNIRHIGTLSWGEKNITSVLFAHLGVDNDVAKDVLNLCVKGSVSKKMAKHIETFLQEEMSIISAAIEGFLDQEKSMNAYLLTSFSFPVHQLKLKKKQSAIVFNSDALVQKLGYALHWSKEGERTMSPSSIASLLEVGDIAFDNHVNKIINRRLRWATRKQKRVV